MVLLAETFSWTVAAGAVGIAGGIVVLSWQSGSSRNWPLYALLFPVGAAFLRSLAHAFAKIGLDSLSDPFFVALVAYSVSFVLALLNDARVKRVRRPIPRAGFKWLVLTGLTYGTAVVVLNHALLAGRLVVVTPIFACTPLFTLLLGYAVFREEALTRRVVAAVLVVVPSVALIALGG